MQSPMPRHLLPSGIPRAPYHRNALQSHCSFGGPLGPLACGALGCAGIAGGTPKLQWSETFFGAPKLQWSDSSRSPPPFQSCPPPGGSREQDAPKLQCPFT